MKIRINITAQDIIKGERNNCKRCPTALALLRKINKDKYCLLVRPTYIDVIVKHGSRTMINLPNRIIDWINNFDKNKNRVSPTSFVLDIPAKFLH